MLLQNGLTTIPSANQFYFNKLTKIEKRCQTEMAQHKGIIELFLVHINSQMNHLAVYRVATQIMKQSKN